LYLVWSDFRDSYGYPAILPDVFFMSNIINAWPKTAGSPAIAESGAARLSLKIAPNPARQAATIFCSLTNSAPGSVSVRIYSITGQLVRTIGLTGANAGSCAVAWDGTDQAGRAVASGVYLVSFSQDGRSSTAKLALVR
jgi:hypothetical protein